MLRNILNKIATLGFVGFLPHAPGSFGSAAGLLFILVLKPNDGFLLVLLLLLFGIGVLSAHAAEQVLGKDSGHIVIDEFFGYMVSVLFVPMSIGYLIAAFVLFRVFDIVKPPPIRNMETMFSGGFGIMMDDLVAGVFANICIQLWIYLV